MEIKELLSNVEMIAITVLTRAFKNNIAYPINVDHIADTFGIPIYKEKLDGELAGCFMAEAGKSAIVLNIKDPPVRQRFTLAHELGHFISYKFQNKEGSIFDERGALAYLGTDPEEIFANKFAAEILMPKAEFLKQYEASKANSNNIETIAKYFNVSKQAIEIRLKTTRDGLA